MLSGKRQTLPLASNTFATLIPALLSVPLALIFGLAIPLFALGIQSDPTAGIVGIIGLGVLASLDIRRGFKKTLEGFAVTLIFSAYVIDRSLVGQSLLPLSYGDWSFLFVALPSALGVVLAGFLFAKPSKYQMVMANLSGSIALAIGLGVGASMKAAVPSSDSAVFAPLYYAVLGVAANMVQVGLFYVQGRFWKSRRTFVMMPTAFFGYNLVGFIGFAMTGNLNALYPFFASLAILPALTLAGGGSGSVSVKAPTVSTLPKATTLPKPSAPPSRPSGSPSSPPPNITVSGISSVQQQGKELLIKILTESRGHVRNMRSIMATVLKPGGRKENLKLSRTSRGEYKAKFKPDTSGNYTVQVGATSEERASAEKSVSFTAQSPPSQHSSPPRAPIPIPQSRPSTAPVPSPIFRPSPPPLPAPQPSSFVGKAGLPSLSNWDPRVWVNQELHGYKVNEYLATGLSGYVLRASFEHSGNEVAMKIPILKPGTATTALDETMAEATRLLELSAQSKYLVQLRGILVDRLNVQEIAKGDAALYLKSPPAIVMELMKGGTAKHLLEEPAYDSLYYSEKWGGIVMLVGYMIAMGLETIHNAGFVHLDVKPQNILFNLKPPTTGRDFKDQIRSGTLVPKLADLGSAVRIGGKVNQFTSEYAAGEQVLGGTTAAASMDIYALGATMYNLLTKTPANSKKLIDAMNNMSQNSGKANELKSTWNAFRPDLGRISKFSSSVSILEKMLSVDPQKRPNATSVANVLKNLGDMAVS